jgi:hypothetical protein
LKHPRRTLHPDFRRAISLALVLLTVSASAIFLISSSAVRSCGMESSTIDRVFGIESRERTALRDDLAYLFPGSSIQRLSGDQIFVSDRPDATVSRAKAQVLLERWHAIYDREHGASPHNAQVALTVFNAHGIVELGSTGCSPWP